MSEQQTKAAPAKDKTPLGMVRCRIARGRSVIIPVGTKAVGIHTDGPRQGQVINAPVLQFVSEGNWLTLPDDDDLKRMRQQGYIMLPSEENLVVINPPSDEKVVHRFAVQGEGGGGGGMGGTPSY